MSLDVSEIQCACLGFCSVEKRRQPSSTAWPEQSAPNAPKLTYSIKIILSRHWNSNSESNHFRFVLNYGSTSNNSIICYGTKTKPILSHQSFRSCPTNEVGANAATSTATTNEPEEIGAKRANNTKALARINKRICPSRSANGGGREICIFWPKPKWYYVLQVLQYLNLAQRWTGLKCRNVHGDVVFSYVPHKLLQELRCQNLSKDKTQLERWTWIRRCPMCQLQHGSTWAGSKADIWSWVRREDWEDKDGDLP